jgi:hypothetical protein
MRYLLLLLLASPLAAQEPRQQIEQHGDTIIISRFPSIPLDLAKPPDPAWVVIEYPTGLWEAAQQCAATEGYILEAGHPKPVVYVVPGMAFVVHDPLIDSLAHAEDSTANIIWSESVIGWTDERSNRIYIPSAYSYDREILLHEALHIVAWYSPRHAYGHPRDLFEACAP